MNRTTGILILFFALFLLHYVVYRAQHLSFTHDESLSYLVVDNFHFQIDTTEHLDTKTVSLVEADYLTYLLSPNTHLFNSAWMYLANRFIGNSEWILRMLSVLSFIVYLLYAYKIIRIPEDKRAALPIFIVLTSTTYFLDFFSLARGYGMSMTFMLMSIYYLMKGLGKNFILISANKILLAFLFAVLSAIANLMWLHFLIAIMLILLPVVMRASRSSNDNQLASVTQLRCRLVFIALFGFVILLPYVLILQRFGQFYYGSVDFLNGTLSSLAERWLYAEDFTPYKDIALYVSMAIFLVMMIAGLRSLRHGLESRFIPLLLLLLVATSIYLQHLLLDIPLPYGRTGMPIMLLFIISIVWLSLNNYKLLWAAAIIQLSIFAGSFNYSHTFDWQYDADTRQAFSSILEAGKDKKDATVSSNWYYVPTLNYYQSIRGADQIEKVLYSAQKDAEYVYINLSDTFQIQQSAYRKIDFFPVSDNTLYQHK